MSHPTLYLDEDVNPLLAQILNQRGFSVKTTKECKMLGRSDQEQFLFPIKNNFVFFTHNIADFCQIAVEFGGEKKNHSGIILAPQLELPSLLRATLRFFQEWSDKKLENHVIWLHQYLKMKD